MTDAPYALRLSRAILLVAVGVALHLPRPAGIPFPAPSVPPSPLVHAELADAEIVNAKVERDRATIVVEHSNVLARPVAELDRNVPRQPRPDLPVGTAGLILAAQKVGPADATRLMDVARTDEPRTAAAVAVDRQVAPTDVPSPSDDSGSAAPPVETPSPRPPVAETPPAATPRISAAATPRLSPAASSRLSEEALVRQLIDRYTGALERLDVGAAQAVWPTVDGKALKRAFGQLSEQRLTLQACGITISGSTANARCRGSATYRPRVGTRATKIASGEWTFDLSKEDAAWRIVNTFVR